MSKEFFPRECWDELSSFFLSDHGLGQPLEDLDSLKEDPDKLASQYNAVLQKASGVVQSKSAWHPVRETVAWHHQVEIHLTPNGATKSVNLKVDMSLAETGVEDKLIGKSAQTVPFKTSFNVKKLNPSHSLFFTSGKNFSGTIAIKKVLGPPFKLPIMKAGATMKSFKVNLLHFLRSLPFHLADDYLAVLNKNKLEGSLRKLQMSTNDFLTGHGSAIQFMNRTVKDMIHSMGKNYDPELEMAFYQDLYAAFCDQQNQFEPHIYMSHIAALFDQKFKDILNDILKQLSRQQKSINKTLGDYGEVENEKQRFFALKKDLEAQKSKGAGDEILRRGKQDLAKISKRINKMIRKYESSKGIILMQELYLSTLEKSSHLKNAIGLIDKELQEFKTLLQANHISIARDMEKLTKSLGVHSHHLLVQHAIYSETEPDLSKIVLIDQLSTFDNQEVAPILALIPSLSSKLQGDKINSNQILQATLNTKISEGEKKAFHQYVNNHPDPRNNAVSRFTQQLDSFIEISSAGQGLAPIVEFLSSELKTIKSVVSFAASQNKCNTDFKNHLQYYMKLFMEPYMNLLESSNHESAEEMDRAYDKVSNSIKIQLELKYTYAQERALLAMFRHINSQLQNENLFAAKVFSKQIKNFIGLLAKHKKFISQDLMKKVLETYTVFMMGCSRTRTLSQESSSISRVDISSIRDHSSTLTSRK
ncbi:MAG: hypothetical protein HQL32_04795 [Planctomycetes bacterium]|nr:hypothetical protein [Planctomycetota bacterium]